MGQNFALYTYRQIHHGGAGDPTTIECVVYVDLENPKTMEEAQAAGQKLVAQPPPDPSAGPLSFMVVPIQPWPGSV
jgi:hypothetical protein